MKNTKNYLCAVVLLSAGMVVLSLNPVKAQENQQNIQIQQNNDSPKGEGKNASASDADFPMMEIGFRFMPTFSSFQLKDSGGGEVDGDFSFGYGFGAVIGVNFQEHIGLQGELIYSSIAQKYRDQDLDYTVKLHYINIPLLFALNTGKTKVVNLNVVVGPQFGINVGSDIKTVDGNEDVAVLAVRGGDLGFAYGAGLQFGHQVKFDLGFRGVYGLIDISDDSRTKTTDQYYVLDRTHVKTYSLYAGLSFLF
ncbi:MAG: porin family protein [Chitinophagales bacterium]|nr:porin family protein [Chitinophagales bacterium]